MIYINNWIDRAVSLVLLPLKTSINLNKIQKLQVYCLNSYVSKIMILLALLSYSVYLERMMGIISNCACNYEKLNGSLSPTIGNRKGKNVVEKSSQN